MSRYGRRRRQRKIYFGSFYLNPSVQYLSTIVSAIALAGFVFTGVLLFRYTDEEDLINRGKMQLREQKVEYAAKTFQTLVSHHPDSYEGHLLLGQAYLELDERRKAEQQFQIAASLKNRGRSDSAPEIAMSKVAIAQNDFPKAESILQKAWRAKKRQDRDVRQALFELYEQWGASLEEKETKDYGQIIEKYELSLRYVKDFEAEQSVKEKLIDNVTNYSDALMRQKDYAEAIKVLKMSLRFRYLPDTLAKIADAYGRMGLLDDSITWYRKAYDVDPEAVGLRYTQVLVQKGQKLIAEKKPEEAKTFFDEADQVSRQAKIPLHTLYPVDVATVKIAYDYDADTGEIEPAVEVRFINGAPRDLSYLVGKAQFISGDEVLTEVTEVIASPEEPLPIKGDKQSARTVTFKPESKLNVHSLNGGRFTVKISIAYQDGKDQQWRVKTIQEAVLKGVGRSGGATKPV